MGTETSTAPGVFSSASGGAGYRTLERQRNASPVQPFSLGFFTPFAVGGAPPVRVRPAVPFADAAAQHARSGVMPAPSVQHGAVLAPSPFETRLSSSAVFGGSAGPSRVQRSDVFGAL